MDKKKSSEALCGSLSVFLGRCKVKTEASLNSNSGYCLIISVQNLRKAAPRLSRAQSSENTSVLLPRTNHTELLRQVFFNFTQQIISQSLKSGPGLCSLSTKQTFFNLIIKIGSYQSDQRRASETCEPLTQTASFHLIK